MNSGNGDDRITAIDEHIAIVDDHLVYKGKQIELSAITSIRFGGMPIRFDMYRIGSRYMLEVKTLEKTLQINMRSYFGIAHDKVLEKFDLLLNAIWDQTVTRLLDLMTDKINRGEAVTIGKCEISDKGVRYKNFLINWDDLSFQRNYNRLTLNSRSNPSVWTNLYYTETDNVQVLMEYLDRKMPMLPHQ